MKLKVYRFNVLGAIESKRIRWRWYELTKPVIVEIHTNDGVLRITALEGFKTDGRSGGILVDPIFPNWGTQREKACVLVHDILFHDYDISFETSNDILKQMIELIPYSPFRAWCVWKGVSTWIARKAFGNNTEAQNENKRLANVRWSNV